MRVAGLTESQINAIAMVGIGADEPQELLLRGGGTSSPAGRIIPTLDADRSAAVPGLGVSVSRQATHQPVSGRQLAADRLQQLQGTAGSRAVATHVFAQLSMGVHRVPAQVEQHVLGLPRLADLRRLRHL